MEEQRSLNLVWIVKTGIGVFLFLIIMGLIGSIKTINRGPIVHQKDGCTSYGRVQCEAEVVAIEQNGVLWEDKSGYQFWTSYRDVRFGEMYSLQLEEMATGQTVRRLSEATLLVNLTLICSDGIDPWAEWFRADHIPTKDGDFIIRKGKYALPYTEADGISTTPTYFLGTLEGEIENISPERGRALATELGLDTSPDSCEFGYRELD